VKPQPSAVPAPQTRKLPSVGAASAQDSGSAQGTIPTASPASPIQSSLLKQRYQLIKKLGVGGYGIVHKALDTEFGGRLVAIKEINQAELDEKDRATATNAFQQEAFMLAGLTHPNLPSIYDYFMENGRWYLVMSYIEGETLEMYMNRAEGGRLPVEKVLMIGTQLASVLSYLHKRNPAIIFRDLKPSNIMRISDGQIYLIDFGIARHFKVGQSKDTIALGSPGYAAPEQYGRAQSTPQTDVYSLGATLHHMLTGIDPSDSPFNHVPLDLPRYPQLSILLNCMLEMDPRKRPASMGNIKRELQRISAGRSYPSAPPSRNQHQHPHASPASPQVQGFGGKLWQAILTSVAPAEYTPKERGIRHNSY
jgi:serine/threonine protein kinase